MNYDSTFNSLLHPTLVTTKFIVLIILVFLLFACGSNNGTHRNPDLAAPPAPVSASVAPTLESESEADSVQQTPAAGNTAIACHTEQSALAEALLELTNQTRAAAQICGNQKFPAAAALTLHPVLSHAAKAHSDDMASADFFSHQGSDGLQVWDRALAKGYQFRTIAENIAAGHESAAEVHNGWLKSASHCENLMNPDVTHFGAACSTNPDAELRRYWGTVFAQPRQPPAQL